MIAPITEPPIRIGYHGRFHTGANLSFSVKPDRRIYQQTAKRIAFRALTTERLTAQLLHVVQVARLDDVAGEHRVIGGWLIADPSGNVTAHRGEYRGQGSPWELANNIVPDSAWAVQIPVLNGPYRTHPEAYQKLVADHAAAMERLSERHAEGITAGNRFATIRIHPDPVFLGLLRTAIGNRETQMILHDWLAERGFPHVDELRSKRWNQGKWTENQLLDLLSKPFASSRRSFSGRTV
jgi:hypothetical protein